VLIAATQCGTSFYVPVEQLEVVQKDSECVESNSVVR